MQQAQQQHLGNIFTAQFSDMSKAQLYDIMSQMQALIAQNEQQAREIFIENPPLTRALFQALMMLGMVERPKVRPKNQQRISEPQTTLTQTIEGSQAQPVRVGQNEPSSSQTLLPDRRQRPLQPAGSARPVSVPLFTFQSQAMPSELSAPQTKNFLNVHVPPVPHSSYTQIQNLSLSSPALPHFSTLPVYFPMTQQTLQNPGVFNQPLQTPSSLHPRPVAMPSFTHQFYPQMRLGLQPSIASQVPLSQSSFHQNMTYFMPSSSFLQGQPQLPSPPSSQYHYQVGSSHTGLDYGVQAVTPMQTDRIPWAFGPPEVTADETRQQGSIPMLSGHMASISSVRQAGPSPLAPEMEKALLEQVMSLTPEQIHLLPPEQRNQVLQLQEMLR